MKSLKRRLILKIVARYAPGLFQTKWSFGKLMKLLKAKIINFRLLQDFEIVLDVNTTSIVGKNNSGKTSLSAIFDIFLNKKRFLFADFSLKIHKKFVRAYKYYNEITKDNKEKKIQLIQNEIPKIQLFLTIQYGEDDNWTNIKPFFTSLEESNELTILFEYAPDSTEKFLKNIKESMNDLNSDNLISWNLR